jgi:hypothetical protein
MGIIGIILLVCALGAVIFAFVQHRSAKKLLAAPFHATGEVAANPTLADAKGLISFEGQVMPLQQLVAPVSGKPCIYYEVEVERLWSKWETTENGSTQKKGKSNVQTQKVGSVFAVNDGSGPMQVDAREGVKVDSGDIAQSFEQTLNMSSGNLVVGHFQMFVPPSMSSDESTYGIRVVERIVDPQGHMFVVGKHEGQLITKTPGMLGNLRLSRRGREALIGGTAKKAKIGFISSAAAAVIGLPLGIFGGMPSGSGGTSCDTVLAQGVAMPKGGCRGSVSSRSGNEYTWKVSAEDDYAVEVNAPPGVKYPIAPVVTLTNASGKVVIDREHGDFHAHLAPGAYKLQIQDADLAAGRATKFKGGFSYILDVHGTKALPSAAR